MAKKEVDPQEQGQFPPATEGPADGGEVTAKPVDAGETVEAVSIGEVNRREYEARVQRVMELLAEGTDAKAMDAVDPQTMADARKRLAALASQ